LRKQYGINGWKKYKDTKGPDEKEKEIIFSIVFDGSYIIVVMQ
jgi:hypothetical protein